MKCRNITTDKSIVWFNSAGKDYSSIRVHVVKSDGTEIDEILQQVDDTRYSNQTNDCYIHIYDTTHTFILYYKGSYAQGTYDMYGRLTFSGTAYDSTKSFFAWKSIKTENFATKQRSIASSLTQKLSVLRSELWYSINYGIPLLEKQKSKLTIDSFISSVVLEHDDVVKILSFSSSVTNHKYSCNMQILSTYGEIDLTI